MTLGPGVVTAALGHVSSALLKRDNSSTTHGTATDPAKNGSSIQAVVSALVVSAAVFAIMVSIFILFRRAFKKIYMPKTYVTTVSDWKRKGLENIPGKDMLLGWIWGLGKVDDSTILRTSGLDGYFFLRYLRKAQLICLTGCFLTYPILFPINITGGGTGSGLDKLSFSNCVDSKDKLYAHVLVGYLFFGFVLYTIYSELVYYANLRQAYMFSPLYAPRISARTVLITSIPQQYLTEAALRRVFDNVKRVWINQDTDELEELVKEREAVSMKLEGAEVKLIKLADAARRKAGGVPLHDDIEQDPEEGDPQSGSVAAKWLDSSKRPTHKDKMVVGEKFDTIDWCRGELGKLNHKISELQDMHRKGSDVKLLNSAFIEFTSQSTAQVAVQTLAHHQPLHMAPRYIGITPAEVVWSNMKLRWVERLIKIALTTGFVVALVIFWAIPVAFVGTISQVKYLTTKLHWLDWINDLPDPVIGLISGLLPPVLLGVLMALLPIVLRLMAKIAGAPSLSQIELTTQNSYFAFQVVQVFLVTTLSNTASTAVNKIIDQPTMAASYLAEGLPKAANFYITYFIVQGLGIAAGALLQMVGLILFKLLGLILDNTPRKMYRRWSTLSSLGWGTVFPVYTNLAVIAITYSIIAPLVLIFATAGLGLLYFAYRYNVIFVYNTNIDTKGLVYPRALYQTLTGVYLAQICLAGLFGLRKAIGPLVLQVIFLVFTVLFQMALTSAVQPLLEFLPKTLEDIEERLLESENGVLEPAESSAAATSKDAEAAGGLETITKGVTKGFQKAGAVTRFLHPETATDYIELRKIIPVGPDTPEIVYTPEEERDAYRHPSVKAKPIHLWLPMDQGGVAEEECRHTSEVTPCSVDGAVIDEKGKVRRTEETTAPPDWVEEKLY